MDQLSPPPESGERLWRTVVLRRTVWEAQSCWRSGFSLILHQFPEVYEQFMASLRPAGVTDLLLAKKSLVQPMVSGDTRPLWEAVPARILRKGFPLRDSVKAFGWTGEGRTSRDDDGAGGHYAHRVHGNLGFHLQHQKETN